MKNTALAVLPAPAVAGTTPLPTCGVASVITLAVERHQRHHREPEVNMARRPPAATASTQTILDFGDSAVPAPAVRPQLRLVTGEETGIEGFATRFAQAVVEVIGGDRGVYQLMRWTTDGVYADMARRSHVLQRNAPPPKTRVRRLRAQVRSVHISLPQPEVAELSIHVRHGARSRAIAARIEVIEGRWRCSALEFG